MQHKCVIGALLTKEGLVPIRGVRKDSIRLSIRYWPPSNVECRKPDIRRSVLRMSNIRNSTDGWSNVEYSTALHAERSFARCTSLDRDYFFMPCLRAYFALFHASRSRGSPFERVKLRRAARHFWRRTENWSFHQYTESPVCPCPRRGIKWSHAATTFRLAACTVSSNDPVDLAQPSSSISLVSSRCFCSLSLLSRLVFQETFLPLPPLPVFTGWLRSRMLNSMHWWSLKVITWRTHQSTILDVRRGAANVRSIIDPRSSSERKVPALI